MKSKLLAKDSLLGLDLIQNGQREICMYKAGPNEWINEGGKYRYFNQWKKAFDLLQEDLDDDHICA